MFLNALLYGPGLGTVRALVRRSSAITGNPAKRVGFPPLGAGIQEVEGSIPFGSTNFLPLVQRVTASGDRSLVSGSLYGVRMRSLGNDLPPGNQAAVDRARRDRL